MFIKLQKEYQIGSDKNRLKNTFQAAFIIYILYILTIECLSCIIILIYNAIIVRLFVSNIIEVWRMYRILKRLFDIFASLTGLIIAAVPMLLVALLIKFDSKGPVIFMQKRLGVGGKEFYIYKFRSMIVDAEKSGVYSDDNDNRLTRVGKILRKTSIDELPQLLNILKGEMSFIGPRPPLTYHPWPIEEYTNEQKKMFNVRPGITGWAQVNGRKCVEWNRRIEMNVWYVDNLSFALDFKIFFLTIFKVFSNADNENKGATVVYTSAEETTQTATENTANV